MKRTDLGTMFLHSCGYRADATHQSERPSQSIRTIGTPIGGAPRRRGERFTPQAKRIKFHS